MNSYWNILVNPEAGKRIGRTVALKVQEILSSWGIDYTTFYSEYKNHIYSHIQECIEQGQKNYILIGGDGTLNEAVNGIFDQSAVLPTEITVSLVPVGTGNDLPRTHGIKGNIEKNLEVIRSGKRLLHDVASIKLKGETFQEKRYFINMAGLCFTGHVMNIYNRLFKKSKLGKVGYAFALFTGLIFHKNKKLIIHTDSGNYLEPFFNINIGIGKFAGGGMKLVPAASPESGILNFIFTRQVNKFRVVRLLPRIFKGTYITEHNVEVGKSEKLSIESVKPIMAEIDGELMAPASRYEIGIEKRALGVMVPK